MSGERQLGGAEAEAEARAGDEDVWAKAAGAVDELYTIRDTYFPPNPLHKTSKLQSQSDLSLALLDSIPPEQRKPPTQRATYEYLRGKILDAVPDYRKEAEDHLSKAVKLNPSLADAWLCLGNCIWKKGDLASAKNCFNLALSKGPNKKILCLLSMLERRMTQGAENQAEIVAESIQHAKDAIALDVKDGNSWYNLGNACLTSFFVTGAWDHNKLLQSLKAYQNAITPSSKNYFGVGVPGSFHGRLFPQVISAFHALDLRTPLAFKSGRRGFGQKTPVLGTEAGSIYNSARKEVNEADAAQFGKEFSRC